MLSLPKLPGTVLNLGLETLLNGDAGPTDTVCTPVLLNTFTNTVEIDNVLWY